MFPPPGIPKLEDANDAGTRYSQDCTLILTEGDSAKTLAVSGLGVVGRDRYGVFPLKGKLLNVREASHKQVRGMPPVSDLPPVPPTIVPSFRRSQALIRDDISRDLSLPPTVPSAGDSGGQLCLLECHLLAATVTGTSTA